MKPIDPMATKEEVNYFRPRKMNRFPISEYDWNRLKRTIGDAPSGSTWYSFFWSAGIGVFVSELVTLWQLIALAPEEGYPEWVWVVTAAILCISGATALFCYLLTRQTDKTYSVVLHDLAQEMTAIELTFDCSDGEQQEGLSTPAPEEGTSEALSGAVAAVSTFAGALSTAAQARAKVNASAHKREGWSLLAEGDRVEHKTFGLGVVEAVEGDRATICFPSPIGRKRLLLAYAPLARVQTQQDEDDSPI